MTYRTFFPSRVNHCFLVMLLVGLTTGAFLNRASANVAANFSIWHGYNFYYLSPSLNSTNTPLTFHWLESASGLHWTQLGDTNGASNTPVTNDLNAVIHECTNGLWKLYLNRGHASEQLYYFKVSVTGVTTNVLGNVNITSPISGSTGVTNQPTYQWNGPSNLPQIQASSSHDNAGNNYGTTLPGTATSWTPGLLTGGPNTLFVQYYSNNFSGITFTTPTNSSGTPLANWSAQGDIHSYKFSSFAVAGGGGGNGDLANAVDAPELNWSTGGDADWFLQTSETHDNTDAAQSGSIGDDQSSWIETTVTGPGSLTFWWNVDSDDSSSYDYLEFAIDGNYESEIAGSYGWENYSVEIGPGTQTLRWTYYKDSSDSAGADAGYLDEVSFVPFTPPSITFQPIDQTSYPGYPANLVADASGNLEPEWQWYKVGVGLIPGAVSRYYVPTNTSAAVGSYYALAYNAAGGAITRTAVVSFVTAPLPPDWSKAFSAQLTGEFNQPRTNYGIASLVDASGNIYAANSFTATNSFNTNTFASGAGRFASGLFKHSTNGTAIWGRAITNNGNGNSYPQCVARAPGDGVYMSGVFLGTNYLGTNVLQTGQDAASIYLVRFDSIGNVLWVRTFGGTNEQTQSYHQLVSDPSGNVTIAALGNNFVNFGSTNVVLSGQKGLLAQYDASGNVRWIGKPSGWVRYMAYDAGRIYAVFSGAETNSIGGLTNTSDRRFVLSALNATNGQAFWLRGMGSALGAAHPNGGEDDLPAASVSSGGDVFVTGSGWGSSAQFGTHTVSWPSPNGQYLARYDTNGNAQLAVSFGGTNVWPWAAVADASGNVYVTGDFDGYATFGNKTIGVARFGGIGDIFRGQTFVAKFNRNGTSLWVRQAQSVTPASFVNVRDINLAADGVWVTGFVNYYGNFGTNMSNRVYGPVTCIGSPFCFSYYWVGGYLAKVSEAGVVVPALPVTLLNPQYPGGNFQFQFLSQAGTTNTVQSRTNLTTGTWLNRTNIPGDGSTKTVILPVTGSPTEFFRISTQ